MAGNRWNLFSELDKTMKEWEQGRHPISHLQVFLAISSNLDHEMIKVSGRVFERCWGGRPNRANGAQGVCEKVGETRPKSLPWATQEGTLWGRRHHRQTRKARAANESHSRSSADQHHFADMYRPAKVGIVVSGGNVVLEPGVHRIHLIHWTGVGWPSGRSCLGRLSMPAVSGLVQDKSMTSSARFPIQQRACAESRLLSSLDRDKHIHGAF